LKDGEEKKSVWRKDHTRGGALKTKGFCKGTGEPSRPVQKLEKNYRKDNCANRHKREGDPAQKEEMDEKARTVQKGDSYCQIPSAPTEQYRDNQGLECQITSRFKQKKRREGGEGKIHNNPPTKKTPKHKTQQKKKKNKKKNTRKNNALRLAPSCADTEPTLGRREVNRLGRKNEQ